MRDPAERLRDMLEAIARIDRYAGRGRAAFDADERPSSAAGAAEGTVYYKKP